MLWTQPTSTQPLRTTHQGEPFQLYTFFSSYFYTQIHEFEVLERNMISFGIMNINSDYTQIQKIRLTRKMHFLRFHCFPIIPFLLLSLSCAIHAPIRSAISSTLQRLPHFLFVIKTCNEDKKDRIKTQAITIVVCLVKDSRFSPQGKGIEMKGQLLSIFILSKHDLKADNCKLIFLSPYLKST